jgi:GTP cyclohydrolase I
MPTKTLPDIQRTKDTRNVAIRRVGVTGIRLPIQVRRPGEHPDLAPSHMDTVGEFEVAAYVPADVKGTHMSRFTEVLNAHVDGGGVFSISDLKNVAVELLERMESKRVFIQLRLEYFMEQPSPATNKPGVAPLIGLLQVEASRKDDGRDILVSLNCRTGIEILGKTCCPCSREISGYDHSTGTGKGAHAQRGRITVMTEHDNQTIVWFEQLAHAAWKAFSQPVYPVLKRPDEAHVTMGAYANPKFVEDVIRDMAVQLRSMPEVSGFKLRVQNAESIHYHDAYAELTENYNES